ncbi:MAG TPA: amidase, partial [Deltaproteobacteria bacterium]|nr:amidase [Deltaproteobacteria bacterium]
MLDKARRFRTEDLSPVDELERLLERCRASDLNAYITLNGDEALDAAEQALQRLDEGDDDPLVGLAIAVKDNICTDGIRTTCASRMLEDYIPPYNATVVEKLISEDAVIIGKTNMDEFAMGSSTENSAFKITRNPRDTDRV